jgi:hypothetical protein
MAKTHTQEIVMLNTAAASTSGTGPDINLIMGWQAAIVSVALTAVSGTSPTFDVYIQKKLGQAAAADTAGTTPPTGMAIYDDILHFTQMTTTATRIAQLCTSPMTPTANATLATTCDWAQQNAAISAGDLRIGPLGGLWRVNYVLGGTSPVGSIAVTVQLIPFST